MFASSARPSRGPVPVHRRRPILGGLDRVCSVVALVPARNEEAGVLKALESLANQSAPPDLIVVVVNNSTDRTELYARSFAESPDVPPTKVLNLPDNPHKKAGALNYALWWMRNNARARLADVAEFIMVMDADTALHPEFVARARRVMMARPSLGGLSAACLGRTGLWSNPWQRYLTGMQIIEYGRYSSARFRRNIHTMSGAGSFYRAEALQSLLDWRGEVFWEDHANLVEDYETTLALKESGWQITSNQLCIAYTDLMPTMRELFAQRERWARGTVDALRRRGCTRHTWPSIATLTLGLAGFAYSLFWIPASMKTATWHGWSFDWRYLWLLAFWSAYQSMAVRHLGWKAMVVEAMVVPEVVFNALRNYWLLSSVVKSYTTRVSAWK